ncbi:phosphoribosylanthranilate isomerase [Bacillus sp. FJAT-47783]|uniref:phosphoribosylanthranilate isomerase n=1 Tax=Bacillus sp. FJAT-47783 TaxID=2922712 RepID=UPI001FABBAB0|nr:phosphoribosylanthranilate isomerase [Bacillus sp. FJAT-47783]
MKSPYVKICGNQSLQDVQTTVKVGVDYIGFIFAESKRYVKPKDVANWLKNVSNVNRTKSVGVFVNPNLKEVESIIQSVPLDVIQLHGIESPSFVDAVKKTTGKQVWKALHYKKDVVEDMKKFCSFVDGFVIDSQVKGMWGGTGISFDWSDVTQYISVAKKERKQLFIAGGINEENVEYLLQKGVQGIDLASGVESNQRKDLNRIKGFLERVKKS